MWAYQKMMKLFWRDKNTNEEVLKMADERSYIVPTIEKIKMTYFGHMVRRNNINRLILEGPPADEGPLEGEISGGRPRTDT